VARVVAVLVVALFAGLGLTACAPKRVVMVYGDSLVWESQGDITWQMGDAYDTRVVSLGGTALCDYADQIVADAWTIRPSLVVVAFTGNAFTECMQPPAGRLNDAAWQGEKYGADLTVLLDRLAPTGVPSIVVSPPPALHRVLPDEPTAEAAAAAAAASPIVLPEVWALGQRPDGFVSTEVVVAPVYRDVVASARARGRDTMLIDGGRLLRAPDGGWTKVARCLPFESAEWGCRDGLIDVRGPDLGHFCTQAAYGPEGVVAGCGIWSSGEWRYSTAITEAARFRLVGTTGSLDVVTGGPGTVTVAGWALDPRTGSDPTAVHVYVDRTGVALPADGSRPDVGAVYPLAGDGHGFAATVAAAAGPHQVCVFAIGAPNVQLGCVGVTVS
jgi:hypothetical protein